jgi:hypothetical protein
MAGDDIESALTPMKAAAMIAFRNVIMSYPPFSFRQSR